MFPEPATTELPGLPADPEEAKAWIDQRCDELKDERSRKEAKVLQQQFVLLLEASERLGYQRGRGRALTALAFLCYLRSEYRRALEYGEQARGILERDDDKGWLAEAMGALYMVHWSLGNYDLALDIGPRVMELYKEVGDLEGLAWSYTGAGGIYNDLGDHKQGLEYHQKSLELFVKLGDEFGRARALAGLGLVYRSLHQYDEALKVHQEALAAFRQIGNSAGESRALNDLGAIYQDMGDYDRALEYHQAALAMREREDLADALITSLLNIGRVYRATGRIEKAESILTRALNQAQALGTKPKVCQAHEELSALFEERGDAHMALLHFKLFHRIRADVFSDEANMRMANLRAAHETETSRREAEIYRLRNVELANLLKELQEAQAQLVQSEKMAALGDLVAGVAHELNSPLGVMVSAAQLNESLAERLLTTHDEAMHQRAGEAFRENNRAIQGAAARLNRIVRSLKGFARLDQAEFQPADLHEGIEQTLVLLERKFLDRVEICREYGQLPPVHCYAAEMNQVFRVLLENAMEAIEGPGRIAITTSVAGETVTVRFADTGRGIAPDQIGKLFQPQFRRAGGRIEAKMGLFGAYHIVRKHGGEIHVDSTVGQGSTFTLTVAVHPNGRSAT